MSLSIKNVPDELADRLRAQAKAHHRSIQGELLDILDQNLPPRRLTVHEVYEMGKALGLNTPGDSVQIIRELRDSR